MQSLPVNRPFGIEVIIYMNIPLKLFKMLKKTFILTLRDPFYRNFSEKFDFLGVFCEKLSKKEDHANF